MNKLIVLIIAFVGITGVVNAQVKMPALSPTQTIRQDFGIGFIELTYSRPAAKGRKIFGDLVPLNKLWRTGANAATRISFSEPVEIGGKKLDSGTYVIYSIPNPGSWEIIFNKGLNNWGIDGYKASEDVVRFSTSPVKIKPLQESFSMEFSDVTPTSCILNIKWEKTSVPILIVTDFKSKLKSQLEAALKSDKKPYWEAAQFYTEYDRDLNLALENVTEALKSQPEAFWIWLYKAKIQKDMGDKDGAMQSSEKSMELAKKFKNDDYIKMNKDLQKSLK